MGCAEIDSLQMIVYMSDNRCSVELGMRYICKGFNRGRGGKVPKAIESCR